MPIAKKFSFRGILLICIIVLIAVFIFFSTYIYNNIKKVENNVFNLYQQIKLTNTKIDQFLVTDEDRAERSMKFTEATKNWQIYQNDEFAFQLKNPISWGNVAELADGEKIEQGRRWRSYFSALSADSSNPTIEIASYDLVYKKSLLFADKKVESALLKNQIGECSNDVFAVLKNLNIGEVRNCYVKENILNQKFLMFRHVAFNAKNEIVSNDLAAVFPRDSYYLKINLPDGYSSEMDYFIQSIVFLY